MKINCVKNYSTNTPNKTTFGAVHAKLIKITNDNLINFRDFIVYKMRCRGDRQCFWEHMIDVAGNRYSDMPFWAVVDNSDRILATAHAYIADKNAGVALMGCFRGDAPHSLLAQDNIIRSIRKKIKIPKMWASRWCNAYDDASVKLYKKHGIEIEV